MPISSPVVFDDIGKPYGVSRILTHKLLFDEEAYEIYSKVFLPITYALAYGFEFVGRSALVTHTACWLGRYIWRELIQTFKDRSQSSKTTYTSVNS